MAQSRFGAAPEQGSQPRRWRVHLIAIVLSIVAIALSTIAIVLYFFSGGGSAIKSVQQPSDRGPEISLAIPAPKPAERRDFAGRMYVEQLESHSVLGRMANGDLQSLVVRRVNLTSQAATLSVLATFTDGTFGDGVMDIQRVGAYWYLYSLTGLRLRTANGYAVSIQDAATAEASHTVQEGLDRLGVSSVDPVVAQTFISQAQPNQPLIAALLSGKYNAFTFGHPVEGTGTITLPATITGPKNASADGHVTLVHKEIDGKDRTFLMTLALN